MTIDRQDERDEKLVAYLDGDLDDASADALEAEIARDPTLKAKADSLQRAWDALDLLDMPKPKSDFTRQTVQMVTQSVSSATMPRRSRRKWPITALWILGILGAFAAGLGIAWNRTALDQRVLNELPLLERYSTYRAAGDVDFLKQLEKEKLLDAMDQIWEQGP